MLESWDGTRNHISRENFKLGDVTTSLYRPKLVARSMLVYLVPNSFRAYCGLTKTILKSGTDVSGPVLIVMNILVSRMCVSIHIH